MKEFDPNDDDNVSLEVPADMLPQVKEFHILRKKLLAEVKAENEVIANAQNHFQQRYREINAELDGAIVKARRQCIEAKLIGPDEPFFLDTSRVMKHGRAYIVKPAPEGTESVVRHTIN